MDGSQLFERYRAALDAQGVGMDSWDQLEQTDRDAWDSVAADLFGMPVARITPDEWNERTARIEWIYNPLNPGTELFYVE
jgi:hypothetical protein